MSGVLDPTPAKSPIHIQQAARARAPLRPFDEQAEILLRLNTAFARADRFEAKATRARALLDRLESAILTRAFRGKLVPQDPNDEPASALLERIRARRAGASGSKQSRTK